MIPQRTEVIPPDEVAGFWLVVRDCLIRFHGISADEAERGIAELREKLADSKVPGAVEMIYHDEPFYVACDIARQRLDIRDPAWWEEYQEMLDRPFPVLDHTFAD